VRSTQPTALRPGVLEQLLAAVRPAFRRDVYFPDPADPILGLKPCGVTDCPRPVQELGMCSSHYSRWRLHGRPELTEYLVDPGPPLRKRGWQRPQLDFQGLPPRLRLEMQYAVQRRHDDRSATAPPYIVTRTIRMLATTGVESLLERSGAEWRQFLKDQLGQKFRGSSAGRVSAFLMFAVDCVQDLRDGRGLDVEYDRDVWRIAKLGLDFGPSHTYVRSHLRFDRIPQRWLRELAKRWARLRLNGGVGIGRVTSDVAAVTRFAKYLTNNEPSVQRMKDIDRAAIERYLSWLTSQVAGRQVHAVHVDGVRLFLHGVRRYGWDDLHATAVFYPSDNPKRTDAKLPRNLAEHVMAQVEQPHNLDRWPTPAGRLVTMVLIRCGLRSGDACALRFDCLVHDAQGAPYLRYTNHKMRREAAVPIDEEVEAEIRAQQKRVLQRWPDADRYLFPRENGNVDGRRPLVPSSYRGMLRNWLATVEVRDEHGRAVHLTPHQWRHTFATRLINRDVPQEVIRVLLDHDSQAMTSRYAKITDQTVRRQWEQATKVNVKGERVAIDPEGPLGQAQWAKVRYGMATQTLSNGYCGLPVQKSCPHANACLTCPVFLTGPEFLPELREQRTRTLTLIGHAQSCGRSRVVEMNQQVLTNLDRMLGELDAEPGVADAG
jgi:integrase